MLVLSSSMKSRKRLDRDVVDAFATHSGLVHDVTETNVVDAFATHSGLVCDVTETNVVDAFATHSGLVCDVTETDCWAQSTGRVAFS